MSYFSNIKFADSAQLDAFGRLRTSAPHPLFDNMSEYGDNTFFWETSFTNGSATYQTDNCAIRLSTGGTTSGNKAIRQTKQYMRYQPGRSLNIETTFVMGASRTNSSARIGYFDVDNGIFFERTKDATTTTNYIVRRTNVSGTPSDAAAVAQDDWNVDKMDGNGVSGKSLDFTKTQIFFIQLQFLGVGRVQCGFVVDGIAYVAHQFLNANSLSTVYMSTGCLPVRAEVINNGTSDGTLTMDMICTSVSSGGHGLEKLRWTRSNGIVTVATSTTLVPLISIRAATLLGGTFGGGSIVNRGVMRFQDYNVYVSENTEVQLVFNPTLTLPNGGNASDWLVNNALSIADYNVNATAMSGGTILDAVYIATSTNNSRSSQLVNISEALPAVYAGLNSTQDIITVAARTLTSTGTALASVSWNEEF